MMAEEKIVLSTGRAVSPPPIQVVDPEKARVASASSIHNADAQKILEHGGDADEALKAMIANSDLVLDEATNKRLLRKIDWHLMPIMCVVYGINYLDKTTISYASIMGLKADLKLRGDNYQWLGSMFYFGYLAWEWPTSRLLQRLPLAKYSAFNVVMWGTTLTLFATTKNFAGALTVRFFLGVFEAAVTPGFALFTSQWYTKSEQGARTGIWFSFNGVAQVIGGLVAYGIADGVRVGTIHISGWKVVFIIFGLLTAALGVVFYFIMPDNQLNATWLSKEDRLLAIARVRVNQQGIGNKHFKMYQLKEALLDPLTWAFVFYALVANIPNGGISNFFSQLIVSFGYTPAESLLYGTPGGAVEVVALIASGIIGDRLGRRLLVSMVGLAVALLGVILIVALPLDQKTGRLAGYYLTQASPTPFVALLSLISTNVAGYTKKTTVAALYLIAYCVGNIIGPQTFRPKDAPHYVPAVITICVCWALCLCDVAFIHFYCVSQNRKKREVKARPEYVKIENCEWMDLTDRENVELEYTL